MKLFTICFVIDESRILLGWKKRGFGVHKWNGFGGKVNPGESLVDAAIREMQEESGVTPLELSHRAVLYIIDPHERAVHLFSANSFRGRLEETEEMAPRWFGLYEIPFHDMWPEDRIWLPHFLTSTWPEHEIVFQDHQRVVKYVAIHKKQAL